MQKTFRAAFICTLVCKNEFDFMLSSFTNKIENFKFDLNFIHIIIIIVMIYYLYVHI